MQLFVQTFNEEMIPLWKGTFELDFDPKVFLMDGMLIGDDAQVYMLAKLYELKGKKRNLNGANYTFKILHLNPSEEKPDEIDLSFENRYLNDVRIGMWPNGNLVCTGLYSEVEMSEIKGIYFMTIDGTRKEIITESYEPLTLSTLYGSETEEPKPKSKKQQKNQRRELAKFDFDDLILRDDGGVLVVGERSYSRISTSYDSNSNVTRTQTIYHRDQIVVLHISPEGEIEKVNIIWKKQAMSESSYLLSYGLSVNGDRLNFIYNDKLENLDLPEGKRLRTYVPSIYR